MSKLLTSGNFIRLLTGWTVVTTLFMLVMAAVFMSPNARAVIFMGAGLVLIWSLGGGFWMWRARERVRTFVLGIRWPWMLKFVLFCTLLALLEEAVTVSMTNLAPLFGVPVGAAYITASTNYLDVVMLHSVVVFVPMFVAWAVMLRWWAVPANEVFIIFGVLGFLLECLYAGNFNLLQLGFWAMVYGPMIYLPAYSLPDRAGVKAPRLWQYAVMLLLPVLFAVPVAAVINIVHPIPIHFPPITD